MFRPPDYDDDDNDNGGGGNGGNGGDSQDGDGVRGGGRSSDTGFNSLPTDNGSLNSAATRPPPAGWLVCAALFCRAAADAVRAGR